MTDNPILKRREDESLEQYQIRICANKDKYGLTWNQLAELLNKEFDEDYSESKYRKFYTAFIKGMEYAKQQGIESDEVLDELEMKKIELLEERKKLQVIRSEYNKIARDKARREMLFEQVKDSIEAIPVPEFKPLQSTVKGKREYILSFGDIHFGKIFKTLTNEYSEEICKERLWKLLNEVVEIVEKEKITKLHLINGADNLEGATLRVSQLASLQSGFVDQLIKFCKLYSSWLNELSKYVEVELHQIDSANHTELRSFGTGRGEMPKEDLERVLAIYVQDVLVNNNRIKINTYENGIADFEILGYNVIALHGHQIKSNKTVVKDLSMHRKKFYDFCFVAHFHHGNALTVGEGLTNNIEVIQIPSIMGSDPHSDSMFLGCKSGASLHVIEEGKGRTIQYSIILN